MISAGEPLAIGPLYKRVHEVSRKNSRKTFRQKPFEVRKTSTDKESCHRTVKSRRITRSDALKYTPTQGVPFGQENRQEVFGREKLEIIK